jgi:hypothetical protein
MSTIPPNLAGSILHASNVQQQAGDARRAEDEAKENAFRAQIRDAKQREGTVTAEDDDTRVDPDSGGTGGQGRAFSEGGEEATAENQAAEDTNGITVDEAGRLHVDLEA